jgi:hypothetical protein
MSSVNLGITAFVLSFTSAMIACAVHMNLYPIHSSLAHEWIKNVFMSGILASFMGILAYLVNVAYIYEHRSRPAE